MIIDAAAIALPRFIEILSSRWSSLATVAASGKLRPA
jgi:hypothetical protein